MSYAGVLRGSLSDFIHASQYHSAITRAAYAIQLPVTDALPTVTGSDSSWFAPPMFQYPLSMNLTQKIGIHSAIMSYLLLSNLLFRSIPGPSPVR